MAYSAQQNRWVAVGTGTNIIIYSSDGINWTGGTIVSGTFTAGYGVAYSAQQNRWVANGLTTIAYSSDGINWTAGGTSIFTSNGQGVANASIVGEIVVDASGDTSIYTTGDVNIDPINGNVIIAGRVAIGKQVSTSGTTYALDVNGGVNASGGYTQVSDYRIKDNVRPITNTIDELQPRSYFNRLLGKEDMGFIAHELQEQFPFLVNGEKDAENYQSVNYMGLIGLLVKEIQDLKKEVKEIKSNMSLMSLPQP